MLSKTIALVGQIFIMALMLGNPRVSIITSVYNGDQFIKGFMADITQQTIFDQCELIMINANSPGHEEKVIKQYMKHYPNIVYKKLDKDPGIYGVWNMGIRMANAPYITNANLDDRLRYDSHELMSSALDEHGEVDLVYADIYVTRYPNENFYKHTRAWKGKSPQFSKKNLLRCCLPACNPMWRKSMHDKYGFFDERYRHAGDWEMWLRAACGGAIFLKIPGTYALFYWNLKGLSVNQKDAMIKKEEDEIRKKYTIFINDCY